MLSLSPKNVNSELNFALKIAYRSGGFCKTPSRNHKGLRLGAQTGQRGQKPPRVESTLFYYHGDKFGMCRGRISSDETVGVVSLASWAALASRQSTWPACANQSIFAEHRRRDPTPF